MLSPSLSLDRIEKALWRLIDDREVLTLARVSSALELTPVQLRRSLRRELHTTFRAVRARTRVVWAIQAIERGDKIEAVLRDVGLRHRTNFIKQCRLVTGKTPHEFHPVWARRNGRRE